MLKFEVVTPNVIRLQINNMISVIYPVNIVFGQLFFFYCQQCGYWGGTLALHRLTLRSPTCQTVVRRVTFGGLRPLTPR